MKEVLDEIDNGRPGKALRALEASGLDAKDPLFVAAKALAVAVAKKTFDKAKALSKKDAASFGWLRQLVEFQKELEDPKLTDDERTVAFDWLVVAETPTSRSELSTELELGGVRHHRIGDCVAARRASLALYEGRRLGQSL